MQKILEGPGNLSRSAQGVDLVERGVWDPVTRFASSVGGEPLAKSFDKLRTAPRYTRGAELRRGMSEVEPLGTHYGANSA